MQFEGRKPSFSEPFNGSWSAVQRVEHVLGWLDKPIPPEFVALYISEVDEAGHSKGPNSRETDDALKRVDSAIEKLLHGLEERNLLTDLMIVSDHGIAEQKLDQYIPIEHLLSEQSRMDILWADYGPVSSIIPKKGSTMRLVEELQASLQNNRVPCAVYTRDAFPPTYQYQGNSRIPPITVECEVGWALTFKGNNWFPRGLHGYNPARQEMRALFIGNGPRFRTNVKVPMQSNLDIYPLLTDLLELDALPNNGSVVLKREVLIQQKESNIGGRRL